MSAPPENEEEDQPVRTRARSKSPARTLQSDEAAKDNKNNNRDDEAEEVWGEEMPPLRFEVEEEEEAVDKTQVKHANSFQLLLKLSPCDFHIAYI